MRISGPTPPLPPVTSQARPTGRSEASPPAETPVAETPAEDGKAHGLVRAAEHSHRSDVAALRQWINHPDLRDALTLPDLSTEHKGNGFRKAVAAYEAAIGTGTPAPAPDPVVTDPTPVVTDPVPVVTDPVPVVTDPAPVVTDPAPVVTDPAPVVTDPVPVTPGE